MPLRALFNQYTVHSRKIYLIYFQSDTAVATSLLSTISEIWNYVHVQNYIQYFLPLVLSLKSIDRIWQQIDFENLFLPLVNMNIFHICPIRFSEASL